MVKFSSVFLQVPQVEGRVTRRALKKSHGSFESVQNVKATPNKRSTGKKRKVEDSSSYMISEYLDIEVILIE